MTTTQQQPRVLIAGIGNVFLGDDAFGVEVIDRLHDAVLPEWVQIADYGISGMHLAYELVGGYDTTILIDATPRGGAPGEIYLLEPTPGEQVSDPVTALDAHGMQPDAVLRLLELFGGDAGRLLVVGCEPSSTEHHMGLSAAVAGALDEAVRLVTELAWGSADREMTEV